LPDRRTSASAASMAVIAAFDFGAERHVGARLREVDARLGQADELDRAGRRDRHLERARVGVARRPPTRRRSRAAR
jgi:hypothetical protein